jgi:hypothetical protein
MDVWNKFKEDKYMMDGISAYTKGYGYSSGASEKTSDETETGVAKGSKTTDTDKVSVSGRTYGDAKLSSTAAKYYEELKKKYGNMDFVLVDSDKIDEAKQNLASFGSSSGLTVLIDTDKIEKMATDEEYRAKYEAILTNAQSQMSSIKEQLASQYGVSANSIKTIGMSVDDGGNTSFFAVVDKSLQAQRERIETKRAEAKAKAKEEAKEEREEKLEEQREARKTDKKDQSDASDISGDYDIIKSDTLEGLFDKLSEYLYSSLADSVQTEEEKQVGQSVDYTV